MKQKFHNQNLILFLLLMGTILLFGCTAAQQNAVTEQMEKNDPKDSMQKTENNDLMQKDEQEMIKDEIEQGAMQKSEYKPFSKAEYEKAKVEGKIIFLEFYANWCPICKAQKPYIVEAFLELGNSDVVGFEVNYNDNETDNGERDLARKFGVSYQHTHVLIDSGENKLVPNSNEQFSKEEVVQFINSGLE